MGVEISAEGPLFDGRAAQAIADYCDDARDTIAEFGEEIALREMGLVFRHPTGYYESRVKTSLVSSDTAKVDDSGVVYGPWLEGVGSRNFPHTRFKGYGHWHIAKDLVRNRGVQIAEQVLTRHIEGMR